MTTKSFKVATTSTARAIQMVENMGGVGALTSNINLILTAERKSRKGAQVGTVKSGDAFMIEVSKELQRVLKYSGSHLANTLTTIRKCLNNNVPFSFNPHRKTDKGAKVVKGKAGSKSTKQGVSFKISGEPSEEDVAKALRGIFNKFKQGEQYTSLMSFLIDGLDEFEAE